MVKVSVIIPVYNVENYLEKCLESVVNQTLKDIEIICVNDGSPDNSLEILNKYSKADSRITVITQINSGPSEARNAGMRIAKGEYIGFVDADDFLDLDFYENLYNSAVNNNADIACGGIMRLYPQKNKIFLGFEEENTFETVKEKYMVTGVPYYNYAWNKIYKREALINFKIEFPRGVLYEDMFFTADVLEKLGKLVTVPKVYYNHYLNNGSLVHAVSDRHREDAIEAKLYLAKKCKKYNLPETDYLNLISKDYYYFLGIKILKVCNYNTTKVYYLFGFIPILTKKTRLFL